MLILYALIAVVLSVLACGGYIFIAACVRTKELPWFDRKKLAKTPFGEYYETIISADTWLKEMNAKSVYIGSKDRLRLHGLWVPAENPRGTAILVHGYRSTKLVDFGATMPCYYDMGFNLLIPDQRSHGKSEGKYITFGIKESDDILRWVEFHNEKYGMQPVIISGLSMGASTVMYLADKVLPPNVCGLIADCGYTSPKSIITSVFRKATHLPGTVAIWAAGFYSRIFAGFGLSQMDSRKTLMKCHTPILMIHGTADTFVPCEMTKQGYDACMSKKWLLLVEGAGHGVSFMVDRGKYTQALCSFLEFCLRGE